MTARRLALGLWIVWAVLVWNVVFDHVIVVAGREYLVAAVSAASRGGPYARMDEWMRPAEARGFWIATAAAAAILVVGILGVRAATRSAPQRPAKARPYDHASQDDHTRRDERVSR